MRTLLLFLFQSALFLGVLAPSAQAQAPPADFKFAATTGGAAPWQEKATITIDNAGQGHYTRYVTGESFAVLAESTFTVGASSLQQLWKAIQDSSFFTLTSKRDSTAQDGEFLLVTVTANGASNQAKITNIAEPRLESILAALNAIVPPSLRLPYTPPAHLNFLPVDPCGSSGSGSLRINQNDLLRLRDSPDPKVRSWFRAQSVSTSARLPFSSTSSVSSITADASVPHAGTVVAYTLPLKDAVRKRIAKLSSKGEFFGDAVSITVDNTKAPPSNTITITLYLEFYGPLATSANIDKIEFDIAKKWSGLKTSSGKTVNLEFVTRTNTSATSPPGTPGYHEILLVPKGSARSVVTGGPTVNDVTGGGTWALDENPGTYGHEAGHLMGLPDRYVDYNKQADGSWKNAKTGQSYATDDAFATYAASKYPGTNAASLSNALKTMTTYSVPLDGSENDLMANVSKPPRQSDIDQITGNPGVLVTVPPGSVLVNRSRGDQNLVVTRRDDLFVKPGEKRTQNGIYAACIDHEGGIPTKDFLFDIAPPLDAWKGINAAHYMARLTQYIDSASLFCSSNFEAQSAIWRISDNSVGLFSSTSNDVLQAAGITLANDQLLDFPRMTPGPSTDSTSQTYIPDQLFVADITPHFASGTVGSALTLKASLSAPSEAPLMPGYAWTATAPGGAPAPLATADSTASLTPSRSGVYEVAVKFSYNDSLYGMRSFTSDRKAYVIVPDGNTETFEHAGLADKYPWKSMGTVPWTISSTQAQTGGFSAQAGTLAGGQQSTLAITVSLPADSAIGFSVRTALPDFTFLQFLIDSVWTDSFSGLADWKSVHYKLKAGTHLLEWTFNGTGSGEPSGVWLDNIFFPGNVVVTSVEGEKDAVPTTFVLDQNYPNPFNPATMIRYGLPHRASVNLSVYNTLGQRVAELAHGTQEAGYHEVTFDGSRLASGVYFYTLRAEEFIQTRKLLLVK